MKKVLKSKYGFLIPVAIVVIVLLILIPLLSGTSKTWEPVTKEDFAKTLKAKDFEVVDQSSMIAEGSDFSVVYLAQPKSAENEESEDTEDESSESGSSLFTGQYQMEFYEFNDSDTCEKSFDRLDDELVAAYKNSDGYTTTEKTLKNYASRTVKTNKRYYVINRIDNTLVISIAPVDESKTIDSILEELGYK